MQVSKGMHILLRFCVRCKHPTHHAVITGDGVVAYDCLACREATHKRLREVLYGQSATA